MKKTAVFAVIMACILVAGCEAKYYTVLIKNESSEAVTYSYNDSENNHLAPGASKTYYEVKPYTQPPIIIVPDQSEEKSIEIKYDTTTGGYTFVGVP